MNHTTNQATHQVTNLGELSPGARGRIVRVGDPNRRLLEMGFLEGAITEVVHEAPLFKDPIVVRVRGALIALRRSEANTIEVELLESK